MFAALIGEVDGLRLISPELMNAARQPQASGYDVVLRMLYLVILPATVQAIIG
jgi:ABC-type nitrate/sulfonate/bicarbonate transport system permease component